MVHGACSSAGCYAMEDERIQEIYTLARLAFQGGQRSFQVQAYPFRMTPQNMAKHRREENYAFWKMMKEGYDHFEVTGVPPKVGVCSKRYVFNAEPVAGVKFSPTSECPQMSVPEPIRVAATDKQAKDNAKEEIIASKIEAETGVPGGDAVAPETMLAATPASEADDVTVAAAVERAAPEAEPVTTAAISEAPRPMRPNRMRLRPSCRRRP